MSVRVHARVVSPTDAVLRVVDYVVATSQFAETAARAVFREYGQDEALSARATLEAHLQQTIRDATAKWGVEVSSVELEIG